MAPAVTQPKVFRSPESRYKVALYLVLTLVALVNVIRAGDVTEQLTGAVFAVLFALLATGAARTRLVVDAEGMRDIRLLVSRRYGWTDIADVETGRPGGLLEGHCLVLALTNGARVPLVATRVYSWFPVGRHVGELQNVLASIATAIATAGGALRNGSGSGSPSEPSQPG